MLFETFGFDRRLLRAIDTMGWDRATPIQQRSMPEALERRDVLATARTGSGKTGAFVLPCLHNLLASEGGPGRGPRVLCLCPTRELANQVAEQVRELGRYTRLRSGNIVGGEPYPPQNELLSKPVDFLVGTPGRLIDHMRSHKLDLSRVEVLVLDEADRMLDMGFIDDVMMMARACPTERQTLFFSATLDGEVDDVAKRLVKDPARIEVDTSDQIHVDIDEYVLRADNAGHKQALLHHLVRDPEMTQGLIFVGTKGGADEQAEVLKMAGHDVVALHGDMPQIKRTKVMLRFKENRVRLVVATDVAARGLDVEGISHVVNFDLPRKPRDYVHRIGRTGRAGSKGTAITLVTPIDWLLLSDIEKFRGHKIERRVIPGLEPTRPEAPGSAALGGGKRKRQRYGRRGGLRSRATATTETDDTTETTED